MRNIHILSTDKPTRLFTSDSELILAGYPETTFKTGKNIYITNDEEIKESCWCWDILQKKIYWVHDTLPKYPTIGNYFKKIILTTDIDLIKDGVQAIPDEFLEWYVKNPSCEEVKTKLSLDYKLDEFGNAFWGYDIIIPKEVDILELGQIIPKEEPIDDEFNIIVKPIYKKTFKGTLKISPKEEPKQDEIIYFQKGKKYIQQDGVVILAGEKETNGMVIIDPKNTRGIGHYSKDWNPKAFKFYTEPKQETLEEAAENYATDMSGIYYEELDNSFKAGVKWKQERSYSEKDIKIMYRSLWAGNCFDFDTDVEEENNFEQDFNLWFEQFKKK